MNLRDLVKKFYEGRARGTWAEHDKDIEGMRLVVRAIWKEVIPDFYPWANISVIDVEAAFERCLADASNEKAAGGPTREDGPGGVEQAEPAVTPAADPSPEVCEWSLDNRSIIQGWKPACFPYGSWSNSKARTFSACPSCGKPIVFKEATK